MPPAPTYRPEPVFQDWGDEFADAVRPAAFPTAILRFRNQRAAESVGLGDLTDAAWTAHFARFEPLPGNQARPLAMRYHGHQFRVYNPDLGDGRGFLFAQLRERASGRLLDLATKGSGQTPYSRAGDGRLTLKGGVREVLAAEMLEALGVPTSRAFSLIETGEALERNDEPSPTRAAVLTRLSFSHIRFGSFQRHAFLERPDLVAALADRTLETYFPSLHNADNRAAALLGAACEASAILVARWMAAGFVHGVLNTDNMVVTGESFDYGPYRFLPRNDPNFTAAYFDHTGLYAFGRQPETVFWNLRQFAGALTAISPPEPLVEVLNRFGDLYRDALRAAMLARLGLRARAAEDDIELVNAAFRALAAGGETLRWEPFFFDWFCGLASEARALAGPRAALYQDEAFADFRARLKAFAPDRPERLADPYFAAAEPEELLYDEIEGLWAAIAQRDDWAPFYAKIARIETARRAWGLSESAQPAPSFGA
ncbi:MAG TPA: YdiU family protein [Caulobacteraceae bacterium]|nr:YdiU family protein [Caulobacteraceae bacterium]